MAFPHTRHTRRNVYTFINGAWVAERNCSEPLIVALPQPLTDEQLAAKRAQAAVRRQRAFQRAQEREAEKVCRDLELDEARQVEIRRIAEAMCDEKIQTMRRELIAAINQLRNPDPPEIEIIAIMPTPKTDLIANGEFSQQSKKYFPFSKY